MAEFLYEITDKNQVRILACLSYDCRVTIPEKIEGLAVTEIGPYAFSADRREEPTGRWTGLEEAPRLQGARLEEVSVSGMITKIGNYAFYNCYGLKKFSCFSRLNDIGSGIFTGCTRICELEIQVEEGERSCLKELLTELRQELRVVYKCRRGTARLIFPQFYEEAVENTPARLLSTHTHGCGHQYRYCFRQTEFQFADYDSLFSFMKAQETAGLAVRMAMNRLRYPYQLTDQDRVVYHEFVQNNWETAARIVIEDRDMDALVWLSVQIPPKPEELDSIINWAGRRASPGGMSYLMDYRYRNRKARPNRFEL